MLNRYTTPPYNGLSLAVYHVNVKYNLIACYFTNNQIRVSLKLAEATDRARLARKKARGQDQDQDGWRHKYQ